MGAETVVTLDISTFMAIMFAIVNVLILGPAAWIVRDLISKQRELERSHNEHKEHVANSFVRQDHYDKGIEEIKRMLMRIFDKLDGKADK